jgi:hypothetical protein
MLSAAAAAGAAAAAALCAFGAASACCCPHLLQQQAQVVAGFRTSAINVLIATSVGSEGMDFKQCQLVSGKKVAQRTAQALIMEQLTCCCIAPCFCLPQLTFKFTRCLKCDSAVDVGGTSSSASW